MKQENRTNSQKVARGLSSQTLVTIALGTVEIVSFSIMSRLLTKQDFGYYAAIVAVSTVFSSLADNGIGSAIVQKKDLNEKYVNCAFSLSMLIGCLVAFLMCCASGVLAKYIADESMTIPLRFYSITLICSCFTSVNTALMQRRLQFLRIGVIHFISLVVTTIIAVLLALRGLGYYAILAKGILTYVIMSALSYFAAHAHYHFLFDRDEYKRIFGFSGWLMAGALFRNFANQADRLLMSSLFSVATLGVYSRPKEFISSISQKVNSIFDVVLFPILSSIQDQKAQLSSIYGKALNLLNIGGCLLSLFFFCNAELIIRIFFGNEWLYIKSLFQVISLFPILFINGRIGDVFLRSLALTKSQFIFRIIQLLLTVLLIALSARWGITAVAVATMLAYGFVVLLKMIYISHNISCPLYKAICSTAKGWLPIIYVLPLYYLLNIILPHSWTGNVILIITFIIINIFILILWPSLLGEIYVDDVYSKMKNKVIHD